MPIRLLALDIDGTLTNSLHTVSPENLDAIRRARDAGVLVSVATGRGYMASRHILEAMDMRGSVVHYGGAWILDTPSGETLQLSPLEPDVVHEVLLLAHRLDTTAQLYQGDMVIAETENPFTQRYVSRFDLPCRIEPHALDLTFHDVPKMLMLTTAEREEEIIAACTECLGDAVAVSRSQAGFIEINRAGVSKASGLSFMAERLGVSREETAAMGDSYLDMDMIQWAGLGVCMENGVAAAKTCADVIAPHCDDNGVAYFIDHYILQEASAHV